jgi:hypothetical protein
MFCSKRASTADTNAHYYLVRDTLMLVEAGGMVRLGHYSTTQTLVLQ